jgi:Ni/Fe-hydrogenase subunit HybB-like protein
MKPAILVAFLGYGCSCAALMFDIGLPWRFWHPFFMWNEHSFLFEVFWCVMLYFTVTAIELAPMVLEKAKAERQPRSCTASPSAWWWWGSPCRASTIPPWAPCSW